MTKVLQARYGRCIIADPPLLDGIYDSLPVPSFPCTIRASFLLVLEFECQAVESEHVLRVDLRDATGDFIGELCTDDRIVVPAATESVRTSVMMLDMPLDRVVFRNAGWYVSRATLDSDRLVDTPIAVHERSAVIRRPSFPSFAKHAR